jgi:hypothetical protein
MAPETSSPRSQALAEAGAPPPPTAVSPEKRQEIKQAAETQIDEFMRKVGYSNPAERTDEHGWRYLQLGSAEGRAGIAESDGGDLYLIAEARIMPFPSDKDLILPLMRELLELNMQIAGGLRLGIKDEFVFVAAGRPVIELRSDDVAQCIHTVMSMADKVDNSLIEKYGGTTKRRLPPKKLAKATRKTRKAAPNKESIASA